MRWCAGFGKNPILVTALAAMNQIFGSFPRRRGKVGMGAMRQKRPRQLVATPPSQPSPTTVGEGAKYRPAPSPGNGGETRVSASMLAACRTVFRCSGMRVLQGRLGWGRCVKSVHANLLRHPHPSLPPRLWGKELNIGRHLFARMPSFSLRQRLFAAP